MPKYKVKVQPLGLLNSYPWPEVGESIELPKDVGDPMVAAGALEAPAAAKKTEKPKVEKAVAPKAKVETRAKPKG